MFTLQSVYNRDMGRKTRMMNEHRSWNNNFQVTKKSKLIPFRITDGVMKIGKHKGKKLSEIPVDYLQWMLKEMEIPKHHKNAIKDILK